MIAILCVAVFIFLAAFFNACMDAFENENFFESIFKNLNRKFWYKRESWKYAKKVFGYRFDSWHIAKTCMVLCLAGAIVAAIFVGLCGVIAFVNLFGILQIFAILGVIWNGTFILFYHVIFKVK